MRCTASVESMASRSTVRGCPTWSLGSGRCEWYDARSHRQIRSLLRSTRRCDACVHRRPSSREEPTRAPASSAWVIADLRRCWPCQLSIGRHALAYTPYHRLRACSSAATGTGSVSLRMPTRLAHGRRMQGLTACPHAIKTSWMPNSRRWSGESPLSSVRRRRGHRPSSWKVWRLRHERPL